jgi:hypothetical protein
MPNVAFAAMQCTIPIPSVPWRPGMPTSSCILKLMGRIPPTPTPTCFCVTFPGRASFRWPPMAHPVSVRLQGFKKGFPDTKNGWPGCFLCGTILLGVIGPHAPLISGLWYTTNARNSRPNIIKSAYKTFKAQCVPSSSSSSGSVLGL